MVTENISNNFLSNFKNIMKGIVISFLITMGMLFVLAILLCYTNMKESLIEPCIIFVSSFSILIGSFLVMKKIRQKGLFYGMVLGIIYMLMIYLISSFISMNFSIGSGTIIMMLLGIISGVLGGIIGVNLKL